MPKLVPWLVTAVDSSKAETIVSCLFSLANRLSLSIVANRLSRTATSLLSSSRSRPTIRIRPYYHASWIKRRFWVRSNKPNKTWFAYFSSCRRPLKGIDGRPAHKQALIEKHRRIGKKIRIDWLKVCRRLKSDSREESCDHSHQAGGFPRWRFWRWWRLL